MSALIGNRKVNYKPKDDYYTPDWVFNALGIEFDLDVAAPKGGISWLPAKNHFSIEDDGLAQNWYGKVWMNPPYSMPSAWVDKFIEHNNGICLLPFSRSKWFLKIWEKADCIIALPSNFKFMHKDLGSQNVFMPVFLAAKGNECSEYLKNSRLGAPR
jgi:hypothetical protein